MARAGKTTSGPSAERVRRRLLDWYGRSRRDLPWRRVRDPYAIWVSEVMLQQTRVATVIPYYERFLARFPTLTALARAEESEVLAAWQGLGYYRRARALHRGARAVAADHGGSLPRDLEGLRAIPGIGPYTAGAIASIAFDTPAPVVDGNVTRVLCRLYALGGDPAKNPLRAELWRRAAQLVPAARASDFNQALMELGATVCTPRAPRCDECPLRRACLARSHGSAEALPEKKRRLPTVAVRASAGVVLERGRLLMLELPEDAPRWAGMWSLPTVELGAGESPEQGAARAVRQGAGLRVRVGEALASVSHTVTRFRIQLTAYRCDRLGGRPSKPARFVSPGELERLALPAAQRRLIARFGL